MKCIYKTTGILIEILCGSDIKDSIKEAMKISRDLDISVGFKFNDIFIEVTPKSNLDELNKFYYKGINNAT
jgi:hypothetical protein